MTKHHDDQRSSCAFKQFKVYFIKQERTNVHRRCVTRQSVWCLYGHTDSAPYVCTCCKSAKISPDNDYIKTNAILKFMFYGNYSIFHFLDGILKYIPVWNI